jgi:hypothetical protein
MGEYEIPKPKEYETIKEWEEAKEAFIDSMLDQDPDEVDDDAIDQATVEWIKDHPKPEE